MHCFLYSSLFFWPTAVPAWCDVDVVVDAVGFLPSAVLSLEEPRMLKEELEDIVLKLF